MWLAVMTRILPDGAEFEYQYQKETAREIYKLARHLYLLILYGSGSPIRKLTFERITSGKTQTDCELARLIP